MIFDNTGSRTGKICNYRLSGGLFFKRCLHQLESEVLELVSLITLFVFGCFVNIKDMLVIPYNIFLACFGKLIMLSLLDLGPWCLYKWAYEFLNVLWWPCLHDEFLSGTFTEEFQYSFIFFLVFSAFSWVDQLASCRPLTNYYYSGKTFDHHDTYWFTNCRETVCYFSFFMFSIKAMTWLDVGQ